MSTAVGPRLRVLVYHRAPSDRPERVVDAYRSAVHALAGVTGLTRCELLRSSTDRTRYVLAMDWAGRSAFAEWERGLRRGGHASPLRPFQDRTRQGGHYEIYWECSTAPHDGSHACQ